MKNLLTVFTFATILISGSSVAFNTLFLEDSPIARFTERDTSILIQTFVEAMENNADGVVSDWKNEDTGVFGSVTPLDKTVDNNQTCRTVEIKITAENTTETTTFKFCKSDTVDWHIAEPDS